MADDREWLAFRFASHYSRLGFRIRNWEDAWIRRVGNHHQLALRYSGKMQALGVQIVAGQDLVREACADPFLKHQHPRADFPMTSAELVEVQFRHRIVN